MNLGEGVGGGIKKMMDIRGSRFFKKVQNLNIGMYGIRSEKEFQDYFTKYVFRKERGH
jgi:hypothetical protein